MTQNRIVSFARGKVPNGKTDWERLRAMTDEEIDAAVLGDPDNPPLSNEELARAWLVTPEDRVRMSSGP